MKERFSVEVYHIHNLYNKSDDENNIEVINLLHSFVADGEELLFKTNGITQFTSFSVYERKVFENCDWVYPFPPTGYYPNQIWFAPKSDEEIEEIITEDWYFTCIVHKVGRLFYDRTFVLHMHDELDGYILSVYIEEPNVIDGVLPRLQTFFENGLKLV